MAQEMALEIDVEEMLGREPFSARDFAEIRREIYRSDTLRSAFLRVLAEKFPDGAEKGGKDGGFRRGIGLMAAGRTQDSLPLLEGSRKPFATYLLGQAALERDEDQVALKYLEKIGGAGQPLEFQLAHAEALARTGGIDGLRAIIARLAKEDPQSADVSHLEGRIHEVEGDYDAAIASYERAVAIQPDHRDARFRLAFRLDLLGRDQDAIAHYERLKQVFPVPLGALINLGVLYEDAGKYEKAISCYKLALAHDYNHPTARMYLVDAESSTDMFYDEEKERKDDKRAQILKIPVTDFELSVRSRNCLARMNIRTLGDLIRKTEAELLSFKNFGETSLNEIKEILRSKALRLGMHHDDDDRRGSRRHRELDRDAVRAKPVTDLDLSVRSRKALDTLKIGTVGQLTEVTEEQLMSCKNFGQTSLVELKKKLADLGLSLRA